MERCLLPDLIPFPEMKSPIRNILSLTKTIRSSSVHKAPQTQIKAVALHIQYFWESGNLKDQFSKSKNQYEKTNFKIMNHHRGNISIAPLVMKYLNTCRQDWALLQNSFPICLALSLLKWGAGVTGGRTRVCCSMPVSRKADVSFLGCSRLLGHATREACIHRAGKALLESVAASSNARTQLSRLTVYPAPFYLPRASGTADEAGLRATTFQPFLPISQISFSEISVEAISY